MSHTQCKLGHHLHKKPVLKEGSYVARGAIIIGDVQIGIASSIWYNAVVRGDINRIRIGNYTNVQDNAIIHVADDFSCIIGDWVTIGHTAIIHACNIGNECLIGMGSILLDGCQIGEHCIIGAGALVKAGSKIPAGSMVVGHPAKVKRELNFEERASLKTWAERYVESASYYLKHHIKPL